MKKHLYFFEQNNEKTPNFINANNELRSPTSEALVTLLTALILAVVVDLNRNIRLYSIILLFFQIIVISLIYVILFKEKWRYVLIYTSLYFFTMALLDLFIIFSMGSARDIGKEIGRNLSAERILALFLARFIMLLLFFYITKFQYFSLDKFIKGIYLILFVEIVRGCHFQSVYAGDSVSHLAKDYFTFLIVILLAITTLGIYSIYKNIIEENNVIKFRTNMLEKNYEDLKSYYNDSRVVFHDFEAHVMLLQRYINEGEIEKALTYIKSISKPIGELEKQICTGNATIDLIVNYKSPEVKEKGIATNIDIPKEDFSNLKIEESDLFVILYNLIENAIESCEKVPRDNRWLYLSIRHINDMYMFCIRNSLNMQPQYEKEKIITLKDDKKYHGIGMENVKKLVEKYGGCFEYCMVDVLNIVIMIRYLK